MIYNLQCYTRKTVDIMYDDNTYHTFSIVDILYITVTLLLQLHIIEILAEKCFANTSVGHFVLIISYFLTDTILYIYIIQVFNHIYAPQPINTLNVDILVFSSIIRYACIFLYTLYIYIYIIHTHVHYSIIHIFLSRKQ